MLEILQEYINVSYADEMCTLFHGQAVYERGAKMVKILFVFFGSQVCSRNRDTKRGFIRSKNGN